MTLFDRIFRRNKSQPIDGLFKKREKPLSPEEVKKIIKQQEKINFKRRQKWNKEDYKKS